MIKQEPLSRAFNVAVLHICGKVLPLGFDVSENAPQNYQELIEHYLATRRVLVWNGASDKTIFADCEVNYAFRAWHDSRHIIGRHDFTREGEFKTMASQCMDVCAIYDGPQAEYFCAILDAEIMGQFEYAEKRGGFPVDQFGFVQAYLQDKQAALIGDFGASLENGELPNG